MTSYNLKELNPRYAYLPYCAHMTKVGREHGKDIYETVLLKTYPAFPWLPETGNHINEDPVTFMELCAKEGLVKWETAEERELRLRSENV